MDERKDTIWPQRWTHPGSQEPGTAGGKKKGKEKCWRPRSPACSLPSAAWRVVWGVQKSEQLGDQELGEWGLGPCSASNLLCDFELLASVLGLFPY